MVLVMGAVRVGFLTFTVALSVLPAHAGIDPGALCKDAKGKAVGKYGLDLLKGFGKNGKTPNLGLLASDLSKAASKVTKGFTRAEFTGAGVDRGCAVVGDVGSLDAAETGHVAEVLTLLDGGTLPGCGNAMIEGVESCDGADLGGATCASLGYDGGGLSCTAGCGFDVSGCVCAAEAFPASGQTTCWDSSGAVVACAGTGHDGDIQAGATLSYTDNGDGTITDNNTGLMWEKKSDDGSIHDKDATYTWANALAVHVSGLNAGGGFAGYTDWRLPNAKELQSIVDYGRVNRSIDPVFNTGCVATCTVMTCSCTAVPSGYWSSTSYAAIPTSAWGVEFLNGAVITNLKVNIFYVRAVRGGS
jgi:hypothetical protein